VEGQALREDGKWWSSLQKWPIRKNKMSFGFKHDLFSFALMIIFAFHAKNSAFSKCFPKRGRSNYPTFFQSTYNDLQSPNFQLLRLPPPLMHFQVLSKRLS
jgi:hypothetical protein